MNWNNYHRANLMIWPMYKCLCYSSLMSKLKKFSVNNQPVCSTSGSALHVQSLHFTANHLFQICGLLYAAKQEEEAVCLK